MINIKEHIERTKMFEDSILKIDNLTSSHILNLSRYNYSYAIFAIIDENNYEKAKSYFFNIALLDIYNINTFQSKFLDYDLPKITAVLLSDNWTYLEKVYSKLRYESFYIDEKTEEKKPLLMDEMVLQGESAIWCNTVQFFMANDIQGIERNLNIIETLTLPKLPKNQQELKLDYEFYKALLSKDKGKCEEILEQLVSPKIHKKRNDNAVLNKYVSQPALGYAKLAWRQGIEVEVNSHLIPKEILPIEPLDKYEIPYDFLKDEIL